MDLIQFRAEILLTHITFHFNTISKLLTKNISQKKFNFQLNMIKQLFRKRIQKKKYIILNISFLLLLR